MPNAVGYLAVRDWPVSTADLDSKRVRPVEFGNRVEEKLIERPWSGPRSTIGLHQRHFFLLLPDDLV